MIRAEFPHFDGTATFAALAAALPDFRDTSWRHDACPSLSRERAGQRVTLWVETADPAMREADGPRYCVAVYSDRLDILASIATDCTARAINAALAA